MLTAIQTSTAAFAQTATPASTSSTSTTPSPEPTANPQAPAAQPAPTATRGYLSAEHRTRAQALIKNAEGFLRAQQDKVSGGWSLPKPGTTGTPPQLPGISALVLKGLLLSPEAEPLSDPTIAAGTKYLLNLTQADGGMYDRILPGYNTALGVSALSRVPTPLARQAVKGGIEFLRKLQWSEDSDPQVGAGEAPKPVNRDHVYYGGVGYGKNGRPDNSNLNIFIQAFEDAGVSPEDPAVQRALIFLRRTQMDGRVNEMDYAKGSRQGGFVYATTENAQSADGRAGQSFAGTVEETLSDGTKASRLRAYGSMTYAGFKTYLYAKLPRTDIRVIAARDWIRRNYTVLENPGMGANGNYYYLVVFSRAMAAWGEPSISTLNAEGADGPVRRWADDLVDRLAELQEPDGGFKSIDKRWMEDDRVLITAYALIALRYASN